MKIQGKLEHRGHKYEFEVVLRDIGEVELLRGFFFKVKNEKGKIRSGVWLYEKERLLESLLTVIEQKRTILED